MGDLKINNLYDTKHQRKTSDNIYTGNKIAVHMKDKAFYP